MRLADIELKLQQYLAKGAILTAQQVINILQFIEDLVTQNPSPLLLQREYLIQTPSAKYILRIYRAGWKTLQQVEA